MNSEYEKFKLNLPKKEGAQIGVYDGEPPPDNIPFRDKSAKYEKLEKVLIEVGCSLMIDDDGGEYWDCPRHSMERLSDSIEIR